MRFPTLTLSLLTLLATIGLQAQPDERIPLEQILPRRDFQKYQREDRYRDKLKIIREALKDSAEGLEKLIDRRNLADINRCLAEIRGLVHVAMRDSKAEPNPKERRHKEVKRLEIELRKLNEDLEDLKFEVPYENRRQFEDTQKLVEDLRDQLLRQLFGQAISSSPPPEGLAATFLHPGLHGRPTVSQRGLHDLDRFTEEEFSRVQLAQKLVKRVEVFLEIAEHRLDEIERRVSGQELDPDEPNPLEFYTYEDMLFAYSRAVKGIMSNIDEKAQYRQASEKDIQTSLKKLYEKISDFAPRLEALEDLVRKERDEGLARRYREALKTSEQARKGALFGLGAPDQD
jgi:hypothetical protein